ncbi:MAG: PepSY-associated TM helix domain-containing protein [Gemmatimonadaceae bacterium]
MSIAPVVRRVHRALGLSAGIVLLGSGATGSALVYRHEIDRALNPQLLRVAPAAARAPLQPILDRARRRFPERVPTRVRMPQRPDDVYEIWLGTAPDRYVYADPYRGTLLGARRPAEFLVGWLFLFHSTLFTGEPGKQVAGVAALGLMLLSVTGIVLWWPRLPPWRAWKLWRAALSVRRGRGRARLMYELHRAAGFYASLLLFVGGLTGASLAFPRAFERAAHLVAGTEAVASRRPAEAVAGRPVLPADSLLGIAQRAQPGGQASYLYLPDSPGAAFRLRMRLPGELHPVGKSFVHVDPATGRVLLVEDGRRAPRGARLYSALYPLHTGVLGGTPTRLITLLAGLSLPLLGVSGWLVWRSRARAAH